MRRSQNGIKGIAQGRIPKREPEVTPREIELPLHPFGQLKKTERQPYKNITKLRKKDKNCDRALTNIRRKKKKCLQIMKHKKKKKKMSTNNERNERSE